MAEEHYNAEFKLDMLTPQAGPTRLCDHPSHNRMSPPAMQRFARLYCPSGLQGAKWSHPAPVEPKTDTIRAEVKAPKKAEAALRAEFIAEYVVRKERERAQVETDKAAEKEATGEDDWVLVEENKYEKGGGGWVEV
ncbi:hypothetical protein LTR86_003817 [Recurvomyces mirabilis]|nr:hypothetical protein LTR86_003817 [Recurvomyces mirabilis]